MKHRKKDRKRREKADRRWEERVNRKKEGRDERKRKLTERRKGSVVVVEEKRKAVKQGKPLPRSQKQEALALKRQPGVVKKVVYKRSRSKKARRRGKREESYKESRVQRKKLGEREGKTTQVRNRCVETGYGRSVMRWFRKSGRQVREEGRRGKLEGVYRASW